MTDDRWDAVDQDRPSTHCRGWPPRPWRRSTWSSSTPTSPPIPEYLTWALALTRRGSLIVVDDVVRQGAVLEAASRDPGIQGTRRLYDLLGDEPRVTATAIQTVGGKGYDGFAIALVTADP